MRKPEDINLVDISALDLIYWHKFLFTDTSLPPFRTGLCITQLFCAARDWLNILQVALVFLTRIFSP